MIRQLLSWFDDRTGYRELISATLYEPVPGGARWRYVWGSTLVFTFCLQILTGFLLWSAYSPSTQTAWESVYYIENVMWLGSVVRGIHHFAAQAMVVLLAIHFVQVVVDGAYKAPREINFWIGIVLLLIVMGLSLTGYLLPWDQKGYYATQVSTKIMGQTPIVGPMVQEVAQGGPRYGHQTLTRFFMMHAGLLPGAMIAFIALHIYVFRRHGITARDPDHAPTAPFWPDQVLKDVVACLGVLVVVLLLAVFKGAELTAPADPAQAYAAARPEWYFLFLFRFLKFEFVEHYGLAFGAIYVPGFIMAVIVAMPLIAYRLGKWGHRFNVAFTAVLGVGIIFLTVLAIREDAVNSDHQAAVANARHEGERAVELASTEQRIPATGAGAMLNSDPLTQGPRLFARHCASCHRFHGHDGLGKVIMGIAESGSERPSHPEAADLGDFASREWMHDMLVNFEHRFAPVKLSARYKASEGDYFDPDNSEMADWSGERDALKSDENKPDLDALVEFLVAEAAHEGLAPDAALVKRGRELAVDGAWKGDLDGNACTNCHDDIGAPFKEDPEDDLGGYPDIRQYGSHAWLTAFIRNPGSSQFYGDKDQMPSFADKLSAEEINIIADWLTGNYLPTELDPYPDRSVEIQAVVDSALSPSNKE